MIENITAGAELFQKGGIVMYVLLLCSLSVAATGIERWQYFRRMDSGRAFARAFAEAADRQEWEQAARLAAGSSGSLARMLTQVSRRSWRDRSEVTSFLEIQSGIILAKFRQRLYFLSVIVTMAPLLGLLGTISGMISAFSVFHVQNAQASAITGGVGEALVATAFGLCVAIFALIVHAFFVQRVDTILTDMEQCCSLVEADPAAFARAAGQEKSEADYATA